MLTESAGAGELELAWPIDPRDRGAVSSLSVLTGGVGLLSLGSLVVAIVAALLSRRRLVLMLIAGSGAFMLAALSLRYEAAPHDIGRFDGHARNFALLALMLALSVRLGDLRRPWRYAAALGIAALVTWPTIATPARQLGLAMGNGVQMANAQPGPMEFGEWFRWMGRAPLERFPSNRIAGWIRDETDTDARVLSPVPYAMTAATGRPNASGFLQAPHTRPHIGPEYLDAVRHLEPGAFRRLGLDYVHAPDAWVASLPLEAQQMLANPQLFEPLLRDGSHTLYRVLPAFVDRSAQPSPGSYEALRQAVPDGISVYLAQAIDPLNTYQTMAVLRHAHLIEASDRAALHLQLNIPTSPIGAQTPELVVTSAQLAPSAFDPTARNPVFWNEEIAVYVPDGEFEPTHEPPMRPFKVWLGDTQVVDGSLAFTATLTDTSGEGWTGQDWLVVPADSSPWAFPRFRPTEPPRQWYAGQASPRPGTTTNRYEFDPQSVTLALHDVGQKPNSLSSSGAPLGPGTWVLGVRLRNEYLLAAFIPAVKITISSGGSVTFHAYEGELAVQPAARPTSLRDRRL